MNSQVDRTSKSGTRNPELGTRNPLAGHRLALLGSVARSVWRGRLYKLNFAVTGVCNSRCVTCEVWREPTAWQGSQAGELALPEIERFFAQLPPWMSWLSLTGGEPHLREDLSDIVQAAIRHIPELHLVGIPSNGLLPARAMRLVDSLLGRPHPLMFLSFSIDGPEPVHDSVRGIRGAFRKTWATYEAVREAARDDPDFVVSIETTVSNQNLEEVGPFLGEILDAGHLVQVTIGHNAFLYVNGDGPSVSPIARRPALERALKAARRRIPWWRPKGHVDRRYLDGVLKLADRPGRQVVPCAALRSSVSVDAYGYVHPCLMWGHTLGNLRDFDYDLGRILALEPATEARDQIRREKCPNCWTPCEAYQSILGRILKPF